MLSFNSKGLIEPNLTHIYKQASDGSDFDVVGMFHRLFFFFPLGSFVRMSVSKHLIGLWRQEKHSLI